MQINTFAKQLLLWYQTHGRKSLPWQENRHPYNIWVSEIMLQQTQVITVIDYYQRFMTRFPDVTSLAAATSDEVLHLWSGLGYYTRARNLYRCAQQVVNDYQGEFPVNSLDAMKSLPGIGPSTAAAICAFSTGQTYVALSRVRSLDGLWLKNPLQATDILSNPAVEKFYKDIKGE